jgi:hypothetical protein
MAFEVSYNLENEQQFWDGESACTPRPPPTHPSGVNKPHRARRHCIDALSRARDNRQFSALLPERHDQLQMY